MPFNVLRCYECKTFQIHPQTKSSKWRCKVCNEKQSFLKVFMSGSASECRQTVQKLNMRQGDMESSWEGCGTQAQTGDTFDPCSSPLEQTFETHSGSEYLGVLRPPSSVHHAQTWNGRELSSAGSVVDTTQRPDTQPGRNPFVFQTAGNHQMSGGRPAGGSKWSKYLSPAEGADSSSEDEDASPTALGHPSVQQSQWHGIRSLYSSQHSFRQAAELGEENSEEENTPVLRFTRP